MNKRVMGLVAGGMFLSASAFAVVKDFIVRFIEEAARKRQSG